MTSLKPFAASIFFALSTIILVLGAQSEPVAAEGHKYGYPHTYRPVSPNPAPIPGGRRFVPTIWVDPDGCEHWVMDDGAEGYMTPHVNRQGIPVCRRGNVCGVMNSDQFFASGSARIGSSARAGLRDFFRSASARAYIVIGHTDSRASDAYNMDLSLRRAESVARIAQRAGARIADIRGYGERMPLASNATRSGMARNRRVEIICLR